MLNPQFFQPKSKLEFIAKFLKLIWRLLITLLAEFIASSLALLILLFIVVVLWVKVCESTLNFNALSKAVKEAFWLDSSLLCSVIVLFCVDNSTSKVLSPTVTLVPLIVSVPLLFTSLITLFISSLLPLILALSATLLLSIAPLVIPALWTPSESSIMVLPSLPLISSP